MKQEEDIIATQWAEIFKKVQFMKVGMFALKAKIYLSGVRYVLF